MFVNRHSTTSQSPAQFGALYLPAPISEADRVITCDHALMMQRENQLQVFAFEGHKSSTSFRGFDHEALVELTDVMLPQKLIGSSDRR